MEPGDIDGGEDEGWDHVLRDEERDKRSWRHGAQEDRKLVAGGGGGEVASSIQPAPQTRQ